MIPQKKHAPPNLKPFLIMGLFTAGLAATAWAQSQAPTTFFRYFSYEFTTEQPITFFNSGTGATTVTVDIYNPDGTPQGPARTVFLRAFETRTIRDVVNEFNLPMTDQGTPTSDQAYGFICSAPRGPDRLTRGPR